MHAHNAHPASPLSRRRWLAGLGAAASVFMLSACGLTPQPAYEQQPGHWRGRISILIEEEARPQSYTGGFLLRGGSPKGTLEVYNPLGGTIAQLEWNEQLALLNDGSTIVQDRSLDNLLARVFGTPLPTQALFAWLSGDAVQATGWHVNLDRYAQGRIDAVRTEPLPAARMRIVLYAE